MLKVFLLLCILIVLALNLFVAVKGIAKYEKWECAKWAKEKATYELYLPSRWQVEQCEHYGLKL